MSIVVGILALAGLVAVGLYVLAGRTEQPSDPDDQPEAEGGPVPRAPGGLPLPGSGPDRQAHGKP
jgi:hypothetical protein